MRARAFARPILAGMAVLGLLATGPFSPGKTPLSAAPAPDRIAAGVESQMFVQPGPSGTIADRLAKARAEAKARGWSKGFWFGFGIRRLMGEHSWMGWHPWGGPERHLTLDDLINGRKTPLEKRVDRDQAVRGTVASMPEEARAYAGRPSGGEEPERPVMKEIGFLFRFAADGADLPADIRVSNLDLPFDLEALPVVWAGMAGNAESLAYLMPLYGRAAVEADKLSLLWAIGLHREPVTVVPFVERILAGKESDEVRAEAAGCLGEQDDPKALDLLLRTIKSERAENVLEAAVGGLVHMNLPAAGEALASLALGGQSRRIRGEAVRGLGDKATEAAVKTLLKIAEGDKDAEVRKDAIQALADLPGKSGLPYLIDLVRTHSDGDVRKEAVEAIGDVGGPEAVKVLTEWAKGRRR